MNKKGFTLVEILAVVVLIAVLTITATASITAISKNIKTRTFQTKTQGVLSAATSFGEDNKESLPIKVTLSNLIDYKYLVSEGSENTIINDVTGENIADVEIKVYENNNRINTCILSNDTNKNLLKEEYEKYEQWGYVCEDNSIVPSSEEVKEIVMKDGKVIENPHADEENPFTPIGEKDTEIIIDPGEGVFNAISRIYVEGIANDATHNNKAYQVNGVMPVSYINVLFAKSVDTIIVKSRYLDDAPNFLFFLEKEVTCNNNTCRFGFVCNSDNQVDSYVDFHIKGQSIKYILNVSCPTAMLNDPTGPTIDR